MPSIKVKSLDFGLPPFRKLGGLSIPIADRITLIAGHNGIGKSTILGLIANCSGYSSAEAHSYFNRAYQANMTEIIHLDYAREFEKYKANNSSFPATTVTFDVDGNSLIKRCAFTARTVRKEVRIVPRNSPHEDKVFGEIAIGKDAKIPLPTLYLGMTRMLPVGESSPELVTNSEDSEIHADDKAFIRSFVQSVIGTQMKNDGTTKITTQSIKGTKKTSKHPDYEYSTKCVSLGQDSLSSIATAVASFKKLKRDDEGYPGGLLVIDELDAGFHPHAQAKLMRSLANAARHLDLQIIATTHSMALIEAIHPDANPLPKAATRVDSVIYLTDTVKPRVANGMSLQELKNDMSLIPPTAKEGAPDRILNVYLEDAEAAFFLKKILNRRLSGRIKKEAGVKLKLIPASIGCESLKGLPKHDPHFRKVLIMLDADASLPRGPKSPKNIVKLPGEKDPNGAGLSPERTIYSFVKALAEDGNSYPLTRAALNAMHVTRDQIREHLLNNNTNITKRESAKAWMNEHLDLIKQWELFEHWISENTRSIKAFEETLVATANSVAKLIQ